MDNETFAINAVRKGAQDYLVKGKVDSNLLVRTIRYAIARKQGEDKRFSILDLKEFDGKEGRSAYIAFNGKVYNVSNSHLWKEGIHTGSHFAGNDLTESILKAPHGEEILMRFHIVGKLGEEETFTQKLVQKIEGLHLHPIAVHFSIAYAVTLSLLALLYVFTGKIPLETASYYMLILGFLSTPFAVFSGLFSWKVTYGGKMNKIFARKIIFTVILIIVITVCFLWRTLNPDVLVTASLNYIYLALLVSLVPIVTILDYDGGKIVYS